MEGFRQVKVRDVIRRLEREGWRQARVSGSHRIHQHDENTGNVVVPGHPDDDVPAGTMGNIRRQAGWESKQ